MKLRTFHNYATCDDTSQDARYNDRIVEIYFDRRKYATPLHAGERDGIHVFRIIGTRQFIVLSLNSWLGYAGVEVIELLDCIYDGPQARYSTNQVFDNFTQSADEVIEVGRDCKSIASIIDEYRPIDIAKIMLRNIWKGI